MYFNTWGPLWTSITLGISFVCIALCMPLQAHLMPAHSATLIMHHGSLHSTSVHFLSLVRVRVGIEGVKAHLLQE